MHRHIPNFITLLNLATGVAGIWFLLESNPHTAALMVFLAAVFDFLDGMTARLLRSYSAVGKSLDSLSDIVSFGVLPGFIVFKLISVSLGADSNPEGIGGLPPTEKILLLSPILIPVFSSIRLARFDNDERQTAEFRGLPTPANAIFIASWLGSYSTLCQKLPWLYNPWLIGGISLFLCILMITDLRMFSLKFKSFDFRSNLPKYIFLVLSLILILLFRISGFLLVILIYILISTALNLSGGKTKNNGT